MSTRLTPPEVAATARTSLVTVYRALADGTLHGSQRCKGGKWTVRQACIDAWFDGVSCEHQAARSNVRPFMKRGA